MIYFTRRPEARLIYSMCAASFVINMNEDEYFFDKWKCFYIYYTAGATHTYIYAGVVCNCI